MKIKDIGKVITGKTPKTKNIENFEGAINFITPEDIAKGYIVKSTNRHISEKGFESIKSNTLNGISVLVGCIGSDMGNVAVSEGKCASNQQINAITEITDTWNPFYIYYYLSTKKQYFRQIAGTTTTPILPKSVFEEINIPYVEKNLQDRIADVLKALDNKIENGNKINEELESMAKMIYDYWFLQFEFPNEDGRPYKSSGGRMVWNEELQREIPEGWRAGYFSDLIEIGNGKDHKELCDGNIPAYGSGGVIRTVDTTIYNGESVLIPRKGTLNNIIYVNGPFWTVDTMFYSKVKKEYSAIYTYYTVKLYDFERLNTGTGVPSMTSSIIYNLKVVIPPDKVLERFDNNVQAFYKKIQEKEIENRELASLRDFLLPLLMNGQVSFKG